MDVATIGAVGTVLIDLANSIGHTVIAVYIINAIGRSVAAFIAAVRDAAK